MYKTIQAYLAAEGIDLCRPIRLRDCRIVKPYLLEKAGIPDGTAFIFAIPYLTPAPGGRNLSAYAVPRDYHLFLRQLKDRILPRLCNAFPDAKFALFGDHSPIDELDAAARSAVGILGENRMLITESYSSFVFLAEIITDVVTDAVPQEIRHCSGCGACKTACSFLGSHTGECLSALSQKKGDLTEKEESLLLSGGSVWGCDRCQNVCPHTKAAIEKGTIYTRIPFFMEALIPHLTSDALLRMSDEEFGERAFSWRGRKTILRNLSLFESEKEDTSC